MLEIISNWLRRLSINECITVEFTVISYSIILNWGQLVAKILWGIVCIGGLLLSFFSCKKLNETIASFSYGVSIVTLINGMIVWIWHTCYKMSIFSANVNTLITLLIAIVILIILFKTSLKYLLKKYDLKDALGLLVFLITIIFVIISFVLFLITTLYTMYPHKFWGFIFLGLIILFLFFMIRKRFVLQKKLQDKIDLIRAITIVNVCQSYTFYFVLLIFISVFFKIASNNLMVSFLIISIATILVLWSYWVTITKIYGGIYFGLIVMLIASIPLLAFIFYEESLNSGKSWSFKFIIAFILSVGAILLSVVGNDAQTLLGIDIDKDKYLKKKIAKYKLWVSNAVISATFFSAIVNIKGFILWLEKNRILGNFDKKYGSTILLDILLLIILIFIIAFAMLLTQLEVRTLKSIVDVTRKSYGSKRKNYNK